MTKNTRELLSGALLAILALGLAWWGLSTTVDAWTAYDCHTLHVDAACAAMGKH